MDGPDRRRIWAGGGVVVGLALALRMWGIWYGLPSLYIGDESFYVLNALSMGARRTLEPLYVVYPTFFAYVLLLVYAALFAVGRLLGLFSSALDFGLQYFLDPTILFLAGRGLSAVCGAIAVWLVYEIGRRYFGQRVGMLGGLFLALNFTHLYVSHWIFLEAPVAMMATLALLFIFRYQDNGAERDLLVAALIVGLAISTKYNAGFLILPLGLAIWWKTREEDQSVWLAWAKAAAVTLFGFVLGSPYWVITPGRFLAQFSDTWARMGEGMLGHVVKVPVVWPLWLLVRHDLGIGALMVVGLFVAFIRPIDRRRLLLLVYIVPSLLLVGTWHRSGLGFLMPIYPALALLAADRLLSMAPKHRRWLRPAIAAALLVATVQVAVYDVRLAGRDTRALAEEWIHEHLRAGSVIGYENFFYGPNLFDPQRFLGNPEAGLLPASVMERLQAEASRRPSYRLFHLRKAIAERGAENSSPRVSYADVQALRRHGVRYLMLSNINYDRYFDDPPRRGTSLWEEYRAGRRFYETVFTAADFDLLVEFKPSFWHPGPIVRIYEVRTGR